MLIIVLMFACQNPAKNFHGAVPQTLRNKQLLETMSPTDLKAAGKEDSFRCWEEVVQHCMDLETRHSMVLRLCQTRTSPALQS